MATRETGAVATPEAIRDVMDTELESGALNACINAAYFLMDEVVDATEISSGLYTQIQIYLSAHFAAIRDPLLRQESLSGEFSATYDRAPLGDGLRATQYGSTAIALDTTGSLASASLKRAELVVMLGTNG